MALRSAAAAMRKVNGKKMLYRAGRRQEPFQFLQKNILDFSGYLPKGQAADGQLAGMETGIALENKAAICYSCNLYLI